MFERKAGFLALLAVMVSGAALSPVVLGQQTTKTVRTKSHLPSVSFVAETGEQKIPSEKVQLAESKAKPVSMAKLATDNAVTQSLQSAGNTAASEAASHAGSRIAGGAVGAAAGGALSGVFSQHKTQQMTYIWAVQGPASSNIAPTDQPEINVDYADTPGVNADDFEPAIVILTPSQNSWRLIGATQGKEGAASNSSVDWQIYSKFLEDRIKVKSEKLAPGKYKISPATPFLPGEYAVVLRPVNKSMKFSGADISRGRGDGMIFNSAWSFQVTQPE
ncbi:MAG: hypothetical protein LAN71_16430 [Acidobacteriia bacterium]|nr:hypothetical protein [Terriglobia bacterium]